MQTFEINPETKKIFFDILIGNEKRKFIGVGVKKDLGDILELFNIQENTTSILIEL